jgi:peptidoglycan/LPS O-acetylase OafA/YrhL
VVLELSWTLSGSADLSDMCYGSHVVVAFTYPTMKTEAKRSPQYLSEPASILLDVVRFSAAILVLIAHFTHPEFRLGYANLQILGDGAVPVFFVLSGFVIRYVTKTRESTAKEYFIDRASRIYSVILPAMFFTLAVSVVCFAVDRSQFLQDWSATFLCGGLDAGFTICM